jgi:hypothetical protein
MVRRDRIFVDEDVAKCDHDVRAGFRATPPGPASARQPPR